MEQRKNASVKRDRRLSTHKLLLIGIAILFLATAIVYFSTNLSLPPSSSKLNVTFDFDTGYPILAETQNTPLNQTANNVTAYFSSPSDTPLAPAFSVQSYDTIFIKLSEFSGKYLYDNKPSRDILEIRFNQQLTAINVTFATVEHHTEPSSITLTTYLNSIDTSPVGQTASRGILQTALYPQGTLVFDSGSEPFNLVRIEIPYQGQWTATNFFIDNIIITPTQ